MDMQEFERNRRKKKENIVVNHVNINAAINKRDFINYNPLLNKLDDYKDNEASVSKEHSLPATINLKKFTQNQEHIINSSHSIALEGTPTLEGAFKNEGAPKPEGAFKNEGTPKPEGALKNEATLKMKAPQKVEINLNCIERVKVSLDSLRFEQIVKHLITESQKDEVIIGRRIFENNGVNKGRFTQAREETKDRGIIDFGKRLDENNVESTWYKLK